MVKYRLNRAISATGFCSRRKADEFIACGRVMINGETAKDFNQAVDLEADELKIDGKKITVKNFDYILLYKPEGIVTTCKDEFGRKSVLDLLPSTLRHVRPVGRLDRDSEGLILLTNDGILAQKLAHPSHTVFKRYAVTVSGEVSPETLEQLAAGVHLKDGITAPAKIRLIKKNQHSSTLEIAIREGRNRQVRRMCAKVGHHVERLVRVGLGELQLRHMQPGDWRRLTAEELQALRSDI